MMNLIGLFVCITLPVFSSYQEDLQRQVAQVKVDKELLTPTRYNQENLNRLISQLAYLYKTPYPRVATCLDNAKKRKKLSEISQSKYDEYLKQVSNQNCFVRGTNGLLHATRVYL